MKLKDFLHDLECNRNSEIRFRWVDRVNESVYSEVEYNSNRWSVFDTDDMFDDLVLLWGDYIVGHWYVSGNKLIIDMYKEG